ncbi:hypothetical protein [Nocardiopsis ansamitocini]|uniref:Uncharacterized protein n=1 Tax=Nocardiopsis ansamitocini TaxID=1670832 RepID=A0A9W6P3A4_9ACTN|nr:hypothetical protein [Nocardiopsis ansamitocini]GLU46297.1 hypothetical protein Nans01_06480 [Nocardiopsis ansamitocini]
MAAETTTQRFAYVLTLQFPMGGMNHFISEATGILDVPTGHSRHVVYQEIRQSMINQAHRQGPAGPPSTIFFDLAPDTL